MMEHILLYITCVSKQEAEKISKVLVAKKLVACTNILGEISSLFRWQNEVKNEQEWAMIAKTKQSLLDEIVKEVKANHSYECPCIIALPIIGGSSDFLKWLDEETL